MEARITEQICIDWLRLLLLFLDKYVFKLCHEVIPKCLYFWI